MRNTADLVWSRTNSLLRQGYDLNSDDNTVSAVEWIASQEQAVEYVITIDDAARVISVQPTAWRTA